MNDRCVVVTGATGFLGAALLSRLLNGSTSNVVALVRGTSQDDAEARCRERLRSYDTNVSDTRLEVVRADVTTAHLGISSRRLAQLAGEADVVIHAAANTNGMLPAERLVAANVDATRHVIEFAESARARLCHVSTTAVLSSESGTPGERTPALKGGGNGYVVTKAQAERIVEGTDRLPSAVIARVGAIGAATTNGWMNPDDCRWLVLRACVELGVHPATDASLRWCPVDDVANVLVEAALAETSPERLHVIGAELRWMTLFSWLRRAGYHVAMTDADAWERARSEAEMRSGESAVSRLAVFDRVAPQSKVEPLLCDVTDDWLRRRGVARLPYDRSTFDRMLRVAEQRGELVKPSASRVEVWREQARRRLLAASGASPAPG